MSERGRLARVICDIALTDGPSIEGCPQSASKRAAEHAWEVNRYLARF